MLPNACPKPISPPKPPKGLRKRSAKRGVEEQRTMGTPARRKWVSLQPCSACGVWGYSVNAHLLGNDGAGRKQPCTTIGPLCGPRPEGAEVYRGCHQTFDEFHEEFRARFPDFNPAKVARETQRKWLAFLRSANTDKPGATDR